MRPLALAPTAAFLEAAPAKLANPMEAEASGGRERGEAAGARLVQALGWPKGSEPGLWIVRGSL